MLDNIHEGFYKRLKPIADKNRSYSKANNVAFALLMIIYFVFFFIHRVIATLLNLEPSIFLIALILTWGVLFLLTMRVLKRKSRKYHLTADDWQIFLACSILNNLEQYSEASRSQNYELEKEYKKMAVQDGEDFLLTIEKYWTIGNFKLAKKIFDEAISRFKKNLQTRLIPNLERLDREILGKVESVMLNVTYVILNGDLPSLNHLNDSTFLQLTEYPSSKVKLLSRWSNYLQVHRIQRHTLVIIGIGVVSCSSYGIGRYLGATIDLSYGTAFGLFGLLVASYIAYVKGESPRTTESK